MKKICCLAQIGTHNSSIKFGLKTPKRLGENVRKPQGGFDSNAIDRIHGARKRRTFWYEDIVNSMRIGRSLHCCTSFHIINIGQGLSLIMLAKTHTAAVSGCNQCWQSNKADIKARSLLLASR